MTKVSTLYTIGYAGHTPESFLSVLYQHSITQLIDVRRRAQSRKKGFSKTPLRLALSEAGIAYAHLVDLGTPGWLLEERRKHHDYANFFEDYERYLETQPAALATALDLVQAQPSVLLCLEATPDTCHRTSVAAALAALSGDTLAVEHLYADGVG